MEKQKILPLLKPDPKKVNFNILVNDIDIIAKPKKDTFRVVYYNCNKKTIILRIILSQKI